MSDRNTKVRRRIAAGKFRLRIRDLRNLGPRSERLLEEAGIRGVEELRRRGALEAYLAVRRAGGSSSLNLLWSLAGALEPWPEGRDWREVAASDARLPLMLEVESREAARAATLQAAAPPTADRPGRQKAAAAPWVPGMPFDEGKTGRGRRGRRRVRPAS